ncbi:hypothetical protein ACROYT_G014255 [Oculina patagonica]
MSFVWFVGILAPFNGYIVVYFVSGTRDVIFTHRCKNLPPSIRFFRDPAKASRNDSPPQNLRKRQRNKHKGKETPWEVSKGSQSGNVQLRINRQGGCYDCGQVYPDVIRERLLDLAHTVVMLEKKKAKKKKLTKDKREKALQMYALLSNVLMLVEITLILPLSTAFCEQGFSVMGKIKSDWKSCLSVEVLDCLMRIRIEGTSVAEFNPQPGVQFWWDSGTRMRRPTFND